MNIRNRIAAGQLPGDARVDAETGVAAVDGAGHVQRCICADDHFDGVLGFDCDPATAQALQVLAMRCLSSTVVAATALGTLARLRGCEQLRLGIPVERQTEAQDTEPHGHIVDSCVVATDPANTVAQWFHDLNRSVPSLAGPASASLFLARNEAFELHLHLTSDDAGLHGALAYTHSLFDRAGAERYVGYLQRTLQAMAEDDTQPLDRIELLDAAERAQLAAWNATDVDYPTGLCVHQLFEAQVERTPDAVALRFEEQSLSYAALNRQANRLAHHLIALGVGPDVRVAICAERSLEMVIGLFAILKAGGAYVPLDPAYPQERLAYQLDDCAPALLLAQRALQSLVADATVPTFWLDDLARLPVLEQDPRPVGLTAQHLAYVIYTSGSTGRPKGVMNQHDGVVNRLLWAQQQFALDGRDRVLQKTPFGFDVSVWEFFLPLMTGAQLVMARPDGHQDLQYLAECIRANAITAVHFVPSMLQMFMDQADLSCCASLRHVMCSGEALPAGLQNRFLERLPEVALNNLYGPTEAAVEVSYWRCRPGASWVPIGRPIANTRLHIVDRHLRPVPVGVAGELLIGGVQVARGYLNRPELTEERFVADPFAAGGRLYKTGDLARWHEDGTIEYLGRNDFQVKIHGFRIELGEIEARLSEYPGIQEVVVLAREDQPGEKRLVAYFSGGDAVDLGDLRRHLGETLPAHMVPAAYVSMPRMPLTANGKLDRKALPAPGADAYASAAYEAPVGAVEAALAQIWGEMLGLDRVGRNDNFFALGGHSLLAMTMLSRLRRVLAVEVSLKNLFARPALADLAAHVQMQTRSEQKPIVAAARDAALPLSYAQQRLWFFGQMEGGSEAYHIPLVVRLSGTLDVASLRRALDRIVDRHESMRTTFEREDGRTVQRIAAPGGGFDLRIEDLRSADEAQVQQRVDEEAASAFDLMRGPLVRGLLLRIGENAHLLAIVMHHIVSDGWSMGLLTAELSALYAAYLAGEDDPLPPLPIQYADYAVWQRQWFEGEKLEKQSAYWRETLTGAPALLELPTDRSRPTRQSFAGAVEPIEFDEAMTRALKKLAQRHGATLYMVVLTAWAAVLSRLSGQDDVVIGTAVANRMRTEVESLIGFFVNTQAIRVRIGTGMESDSSAGLLAQVKERVLEAQDHQDLPFEQVVEIVNPTRNLAHAPIFQVMLAWQNSDETGLILPGVGVTAVKAAHTTAKFDLNLELAELGGRIAGHLEFATALFDRVTVQRYVGYLQRTLQAMAEDDTQPLDRIELLDAAERAQLAAWNATDVDYPTGLCVHQLFEAQVERTPDAVALRFEEQSLSYAALNRQANRLAHHLIALGVGPDVRVAICAERSLEMVIGLFAILKAGGAYVPLDPAYPQERLAYQLDDCAPALLLAQRALQSLVADATVPTFWLDDLARLPVLEQDPRPVGLTAQHLAYVIYTSGSTGRPKGVMNQHDGVVNRLLWAQQQFALDGRDRVLQKTPFGFDVSVWEFFLPLMTGAQLVMARPDGHQDLQYLAECIRANAITAVHFVPSMLQMFMDQADLSCCASLRHVMCSGEALPAGLQNRFLERLPEVALNNLYGPTEAAVEVSYWRCRPGASWVPIGRPIANTRLHIVDRHLRPVPVGVAGELLIGGVQVARGYLNRPELTEERFVADPFAAGGRLYKTGDLARWHEDGTIEYLGRNDFQVKIHGFRIELGEIEARLSEYPGIQEVVVLAREDQPGEKRLVAYFSGGDAVDLGDLRRHLGETLPAHMVPAAYVSMPRMPLTANGKLDRKALPAPGADAYASAAYEAPVGAVEAALAQIWGEMLGLDRVGRNDNFFALGGHSLLLITLIERMHRIGLTADVRALFAAPTLQALAVQVGAGTGAVAIPENAIEPGCAHIVPKMLPLVALTQADIDRIVAAVPGGTANIQDIYPLAPLQEGFLFHYLLQNEGDVYLTWTLLASDSRERIDRYAEALQQVVDRHDILRTAVAWDGLPEPVQVVWRQARLEVETLDLDPAEGDIERQLLARFHPSRYRIDIRQAPMWKLLVARDEANDRWLVLELVHHLIGDHTTVAYVNHEIRGILDGRAGALSPPQPFRDFIAQTRLGIGREEHEAYFRELLGDVDEPTAPFGLTDVRGDGTQVAETTRALDPALCARLRACARAAGVSPATLCHLAWALVLARASGRDDVVFGTVMLGRMHASAEGSIGMYINTLPLRIRIDADSTREGVRRTHRLLTDLLRHEHAPLNLTQRCSAVRPPLPLFSSLLNYRHAASVDVGDGSDGSQAWNGMRFLRNEERSNYPFDLSIDDHADGSFSINAQVDAAGAAPERVCAMLETALDSLAWALEQAPETALRALEVLPPDERQQVLELWSGAEPAGAGETGIDAGTAPACCLHDSFEVHAARNPDAPALIQGTSSLSYGELNRRANRLAHHLIALGLGRDERVAIYLERGFDALIGMLAVLKAGGAYVPVDPAYPLERVQYMLADAAPRAVLTHRALRTNLPLDLPAVLALDEADLAADGAETDPDRAVLALQPHHLAYVIYTSGSTGQPKGVMIEHRQATALLSGLEDCYRLDASDRVLQFASLSFDASIEECFGALCNGAALVLRDDEWVADAATFWRHCREHRLTVLSLPTAFWHQLGVSGFGGIPDSVRLVVIGGEKAKPELLARWFHYGSHRPQLINSYGPTETTVDATIQIVTDDPARHHAIGRPLRHVRAYILDMHRQPVPVGVAGELYLGGAQVARGYLGRPELTSERFIVSPFVPGDRLYKTGDLVRWGEGGCIDYLGRNDFQVKIRGFRIELGEIEAHLAVHDQVGEAVVVAREERAGDLRLVAYITAAEGQTPDVDALQEHADPGRLAVVDRHVGEALHEDESDGE